MTHLLAQETEVCYLPVSWHKRLQVIPTQPWLMTVPAPSTSDRGKHITQSGSGDQHIIGDGPMTSAELLLWMPVGIVSRVITMSNRQYEYESAILVCVEVLVFESSCNLSLSNKDKQKWLSIKVSCSWYYLIQIWVGITTHYCHYCVTM